LCLQNLDRSNIQEDKKKIRKQDKKIRSNSIHAGLKEKAANISTFELAQENLEHLSTTKRLLKRKGGIAPSKTKKACLT